MVSPSFWNIPKVARLGYSKKLRGCGELLVSSVWLWIGVSIQIEIELGPKTRNLLEF